MSAHTPGRDETFPCTFGQWQDLCAVLDAVCAERDRLGAERADLLAALRETLDELEALRDDLPHARPTGESAVCYRARTAIARAEGREVLA